MIVVHWKGSITVHLLITCQSFFLQLGEFRFQCIQESPTSVHCCMFPQFPQAPFETTVSFGDDYIKPLLFSLSAEHRRLFSPRALRLGNEAYDFILDKVKCRARTNNIFRQPHPRVLGRHLRQQREMVEFLRCKGRVNSSLVVYNCHHLKDESLLQVHALRIWVDILGKTFGLHRRGLPHHWLQ